MLDPILMTVIRLKMLEKHIIYDNDKGEFYL